MHRTLTLALLLACAIGSGCRTDNRLLLFSTKTSMGVDVDSQPPSVDIGYSRKEGSYGPSVQGQVLPLLASFHGATGAGRLFGFNAGQSFATGNAALLMSRYIGKPTEPVLGGEHPLKDDTLDVMTPAHVSGKVDGAPSYYFGTDTTLGLKVGFGTQINSVHFGWKRKELSIVPLEIGGQGDAQTVQVPSFLATTVARAEAGRDGRVEAGAAVNQIYATGLAATYLAALPEIRDTIGKDLIADAEAQEKLFESAVTSADYWRERGRNARGDAEDLLAGLDEDQLDEARILLFGSGIATRAEKDLLADAWASAGVEERRAALLSYAIASTEDDVLALERWTASLRNAAKTDDE